MASINPVVAFNFLQSLSSVYGEAITLTLQNGASRTNTDGLVLTAGSSRAVAAAPAALQLAFPITLMVRMDRVADGSSDAGFGLAPLTTIDVWLAAFDHRGVSAPWRMRARNGDVTVATVTTSDTPVNPQSATYFLEFTETAFTAWRDDTQVVNSVAARSSPVYFDSPQLFVGALPARSAALGANVTHAAIYAGTLTPEDRTAIVANPLAAWPSGAAITSASSGNWAEAETWVGGIIPGDGDTVTIANGHTVTIPAATEVVVGDSANPTTPAIQTAGTGGTGILVVNGTLRFRGNIKQGNATWRINGGGVVESDHPSTALNWQLSDANAQANAVLEIIGTSGNRATLRSRSGTTRMAGIFSGESVRNASTNEPSGGFTGGGRVRAEWAHIHQVGSSTSSWCMTKLNGAYHFQFSDTRITECGPWHVYGAAATSDWTIERVSVLDPAAGIGVRWPSFSQPSGTRTRVWRDVIVEGQVIIAMLNSAANSQWLFERVAMAGTAALEPVSAGGGSSFSATWRDVLLFNRRTNAFNRSAFPMGSHERLLTIRKQAIGDDDHYSVPMRDLATEVDGVVIEYGGVGASGDVFVPEGTPSGSSTFTLRNALSVPNAADGHAAGVLCIPVSLNVSAHKYRIERCTVVGDNATVFSTENLPGSAAGALEYNRSNLVVRTTNGTTAIATDSATSPANLADGLYQGCDYNVTHNVSGGKYPQLAAKYASPAPPGPNDQSLNPAFVDTTRRWLTWGQSIDPGIASWDAIWAEIRKRNDDSGYNAAFDWRDAYTWIRDGWRPTNPAILTAAHDGGRVGALDAPVATVSSLPVGRLFHYLTLPDGTPVTGLTSSTVTARIVRPGQAPTVVTLTTDQVQELSAELLPGVYRLDWPTSAYAHADERVVLVVTSATSVPSIYHLPTAPTEPPVAVVGTGATPTTLPLVEDTVAVPGQWNRRTLLVVSGAAAGERVMVVDQGVDQLQIAPPLTVAPAEGDQLLLE